MSTKVEGVFRQFKSEMSFLNMVEQSSSVNPYRYLSVVPHPTKGALSVAEMLPVKLSQNVKTIQINQIIGNPFTLQK